MPLGALNTGGRMFYRSEECMECIDGWVDGLMLAGELGGYATSHHNMPRWPN